MLHSTEIVEKWEYNGRVHQLFIDSEKAYDSGSREVFVQYSNNSVCIRN